ncbi:MAG: (2Fe-2S)-binding protein [Methanoregula sp.]|nr:(2Fe-2S)-binding protein [Methanoregula sp.]
MSQVEHSCCCPAETCTSSVCWVCGNPGTPVKRITVESLVRERRQSLLATPEGFSFCHTANCAVVFFNNDADEYIKKADVKVRVGIKETEDPVPMCYCFGWTRKQIDEEIARTGKSLAVEDIMNRMKTAGCNCERNNPSGGCCLKDVKNYIDTVLKRAEQK